MIYPDNFEEKFGFSHNIPYLCKRKRKQCKGNTKLYANK